MPARSTTQLPEGWLSLGPASRLLGVDPDTLRRWADAGRVRSFTTPGGHRRFTHAELARVQERRGARRLPLETLGATPARVSQAYARYYRSTVAPEATRALDDADRATFWADGRELVETLLAYLDASGGERIRLEAVAAETVERTARRLRSGGVGLVPAIEAFVSARGPMLQALESIGRREVIPAAQIAGLYTEAAAILDRLLLRFIAAYEPPESTQEA